MNGGDRSRRRPNRPLATAGAALYFLAAVGATVLASAELRASAAEQELADASASDADDARREELMAEAGRTLSAGLFSGELHELAATRAVLISPADLDAAEAHSRTALRHSPTRADAWARLAYIDVARDGRLDDAGREALAASYRMEPYADDDLRRWRLEFVLRRWSEAGPIIHAAALSEARMASTYGAEWYEESEWMWALAERLPEGPGPTALRDLLSVSR